MDFIEMGQLIRKVRKERGMTLDALCDEYIPRSTLSSLERGLIHNPDKVRYILRKLDINMIELSEMEKKEAKERSDDLMIIENKINPDVQKALDQLLELGVEYEGPLLDFLKGQCYYKTRQIKQAIQFLNKALQSLEKLGDHEKSNIKSGCLNYLSIIEFRYNGNKEKALYYAEEALHHFALDGDRKHYHTTLLMNKAIYLRSLGRAEEALKALDEIQVNSFHINIDAVIGMYDLRAKLNLEIKLYEVAARYAKEGLEIAKINYNYERQLELYITLGDIYKVSGALDQAEKFLLAAIDLKDHISRRHWLILDAYIELGIVYFKKQNFHLTHKVLEKARKIAKKENDMVKYAQALLYLAKVFLSQSKYEEAFTAFREVYELHSSETNDREALHGLMQVSHLLGDDTNLTRYSKLYCQANDLNS